MLITLIIKTIQYLKIPFFQKNLLSINVNYLNIFLFFTNAYLFRAPWVFCETMGKFVIFLKI